MDVGRSVEFGRLHNQLYPTVVDVDSAYPGSLLDALRQRGHNVTGLAFVTYRVDMRVDDRHSFRRRSCDRSHSGSREEWRYNMG